MVRDVSDSVTLLVVLDLLVGSAEVAVAPVGAGVRETSDTVGVSAVCVALVALV